MKKKHFILILFIIYLHSDILHAQVDKNVSNSVQREQLKQFIENHPYSHNDLTPEQIKAMPKEDRPDLRAEHDFLMTFDPFTGEVPHYKKLKAYQEAQNRLRGKTPISGVTWEERGPDNFGGRSRTIMFDPNDVANGYKKVWASGVGGGLWYTNDLTNAGQPWTRVDDFWSNIAVSCIAHDPSNTQVFYVGTGEGFGNADAIRGQGVWKTTDGGTTWTQLVATIPDAALTDLSNYTYINDVAVNASGDVFIATRGYYWNRGGILRSTDGGTNWTKVLAPRTGTGTGSENLSTRDWGVDIEIAQNGDLYASCGLSGGEGRIYRSTDNGNNWTDVSPAAGDDRIELAIAPSTGVSTETTTIYAVADGGVSSDQDIEWFKKSTDGGTTWSDITIPTYASDANVYFTRGQAWYDLILAVKPDNPDYVIVGGIDLHLTTNGGISWTPISYWTSYNTLQEVHADQHAIDFHPTDYDKVIFGNDGGIYYSENATANANMSIISRNMGFNVTQFYSCAMKNEVGSNYFLAGAQDNGSHKFTTPGINSTEEVTGGDGAFCFIDQDNPNLQVTSYTYNDWRYSTDGGASFTYLNYATSGRFINPADFDNDADIVYGAGENDQIFVLELPSETAFLRNVGGDALGGSDASAITASPYSANVVFVGTDVGELFLVTNANNASISSTQIDGVSLPTGYISCIEIGANDNHLLVTFSSYSVQHVWETTDGGTTWTDRTGNLPDMPVRFALYNPDNRNEVLLATEVGVWSTNNISVASPDWDPTNAGLANVRCDMLQYRSADKMVAVATHGRGLYTTNVFCNRAPVAEFEANTTVACTNTKVKFTDQSMYSPTSWSWAFNPTTINYLNSTTSGSQNPEVEFTAAGTYEVTLTATNGNGSDPEVKTGYITVSGSAQTLPYTCGFESAEGFSTGSPGTLATGWSRTPASGYTWFVNTGGTSSVNTGPSAAHGGSNYIYTEASNGDDKDRTYIITPCIDLSGQADATLSFWYHMYGVHIHGLYTEVFYQGDWYPIDFISGQHQYANSDAFIEQTISLSSYVGETIKIRFWAQKTASFNGDIAIDDINISGTVAPAGSWIGVTSTDWNTTTNWADGTIPTATVDVTIPTGCTFYPEVDEVATCQNLDIEDGGSLTITTNGNLTVDGYLQNGEGTSGSFSINDGTCTISNDYYSELGSTTNISGGTLNTVSWNRNSSSIWSKGTINLTGGIINASGSVIFSNFDLTGTMSGSFLLNVNTQFTNGSDDWTTTGGTVRLYGSESVFRCSSFGAGNKAVAYNLVFDVGTGNNCYIVSSGGVSGIDIKNDLTITSGNLQTTNTGIVCDEIAITNDILISDDGSFTHDNTSTTIGGNIENGTGTGGSFTFNDGTCSVTGTYYSEVGSTTSINGGTLNALAWERNTSSIFSKGIITLSGGTINITNDCGFSSSELTGTMNGPFNLNVGDDFYISNNWTATEGTVTLKATGGGSPYQCLPSTATGDAVVYNLVIDAGGSSYEMTRSDNSSGTFYINGSLTITNGTLSTVNTSYAVTKLDVGGNILIASGQTLTVDGSGTDTPIEVEANWTNLGTFGPGTGTVTFDGNDQSISGNTTFYNLTKSVTSPQTLTFEASSTQTVTNNVTFNGTSGNLLSLRSSSASTQWKLNPQATRTISYVDVQDGNNLNPPVINPTYSLDNGNNTNWFFAWNGSISSDWQNTGNWDGGSIPISSQCITIPNGKLNYPVIDDGSTVAECYNLIIENGASVTIAKNGQMTVSGEITNNNGTDGLIVQSDASEDGSLITNNAVDATVQRYLVADTWEYLSSPVSSAPNSILNGSAYGYDETVDDWWLGLVYNSTIGNFGGWEATPNPLDIGKGYINKTTTTGAIDFTGTLNYPVSDPVVIPVDYSDHGPGNATNGVAYDELDGWNLLGNQFTCAIDWLDVTKTNVDGGVYYYNGTNYVFFIDDGSPTGDASNGGSRYIPAQQGFFVKANNGGASSISIPLSARVHDETPFYKEERNTPENYMRLQVAANGYTDEAIIRFKENATNGYDGNLDIIKRYTDVIEVPQIAISGENDISNGFVLNAFENYTESKSIPIWIRATENTEVELSITENNFPYTDFIYLEDTYDNKFVDLKTNSIYSFEHTTGTVKDRFVIHFGINIAPVIVNQPLNATTLEDELFVYVANNVFEDNDLFDSYTLDAKLVNGDDLPSWLNFDAETMTFEGTPGNSDVGEISIELTATDNYGEETSTNFSIEVINVNDAPFVTGTIPEQEVTEGENWFYQLDNNLFRDIDHGDELTYSANIPEWVTFNEINRFFIANPGSSEVGNHEIEIIATDLAGAEVNTTFNLLVKAALNIENISNDFSVFPNPSTGIVYIHSADKFENVNQIKVTDVTGKIIEVVSDFKQNEETVKIDLSEYAIGIYNITILTNTDNKNYQVILK